MTRERAAAVQWGLRLNYLTIALCSLEAAASLMVGLLTGSVALVGFGFDSVIELASSGAAQWRLRADFEERARHRVEGITVRIVGWCFLLLAAYVGYESVRSLLLRERPERSLVGMVILALSAVVMPLLSRAKRRVARALESRTLAADATQTSLCAYLSVIALAGVGLNVSAGWWWADPLAALVMMPIIAKEGIEALGGGASCDDDC